MPTTANSITYFVAADGTLRDSQQGSIAQTPRINYGTEYAVTLSFLPSTIAEGDQLQVALNRTRTFFSSASATGDAPVAAVVKHDVTAEEETAQEVSVVLSTNTRAMIDQVNGIDHPVRGFFGVHVLRGQSFVTLAVADALMMSLESGPDAISPSLPVVDYPTREEAVALVERSEVAAGRAETAQGKAEEAQGKAETAEGNAQIWAEGTDQQVEELGGEHSAKEWAGNAGQSAGNAGQSATNAAQSATDANTAKGKAEDAQEAAETAEANAAKIAEGTDEEVAPLGLEHSAKGWAEEASERMTVVTISAATTSYTLQDNKHYQQVPDAVPTYTLPAVTMDGLVHEITVLVDFLHVTSCSFVDAGGVPVTLQSAISPQIGEAYVFRCYWYGKWRVVPLKIRNAATASSSNGVVEVSDAVAGDALSLKMTAPRSVVVNQLFNKDTYNNSTVLYGVTVTLDKTTGKVSVQTASSQASFAYPITVSNQVTNYYIVGHKYIFKGIPDIRTSVSPNGTALIAGSNGIVFTAETANTKIHCVMTVPTSGLTIDVEGYPMMVDLTQYFNGDQTLIDSITSWDDLVAYDPRFASYVEYNTGTVEGVQPSVQVTWKNIYNKGEEITNAFVSATTNSTYTLGHEHTYKGWNCSAYIRVKPSTTYTITYSKNMSAPVAGMCYYVSNIENSVILGESAEYQGATGTNLSYTFTTPDNCRFIRFSYPSDCATVQLELGSVATSYEPYHDGGTAQAPAPLFAVGTAADEYEAVAGVTTQSCCKITFTGNESLTVTSSYIKSDACDAFLSLNTIKSQSPQSFVGICSHFSLSHYFEAGAGIWARVGHPDLFQINNTQIHLNISNSKLGITDYTQETTTTAKAKILAYLQAQYNAGTPVVVVVPYATTTTSQSTPTQIALQSGSNVAMQTDGGRTLAALVMTYENLPSES